MQLFYERRTFSLLRWRLGGVPRCMGRSDGKRNAPTTGRRGRCPLQMTVFRQSKGAPRRVRLSLSKKPVIASQSEDWRGNPFPKCIIPALFHRFPAKRLRIPTPVTSVTGSE